MATGERRKSGSNRSIQEPELKKAQRSDSRTRAKLAAAVCLYTGVNAGKEAQNSPTTACVVYTMNNGPADKGHAAVEPCEAPPPA
ncbi:hypothetical protein V5799_011487 [Amblyomma americanum]|uniref:Uncharacterized protein n=1 Tax=Amblyomma americanum TaxID=6943 RepID=A0AAQ4EH22_AMBAM